MFRKTTRDNGMIRYEWRRWELLSLLSLVTEERAPAITVQTFVGHPYQFVKYLEELIFVAADDADIGTLVSLAQVLLGEFRQSHLQQP